MNARQSKWHFISALLAASLLASTSANAGKVTVTAADPPEAEQETFQLPVTIDGEGFDHGTVITFLVAGSKKDKGGITVTHNQFVNPNRLIATIDVALEATVGDFDIEVRTSRGRRGKGNTLFAVRMKEGGNENPYDGEDIALNCIMADDPGDNVLNDGLGFYVNGQDKVECRTGGVAQPNLSGLALDTQTKGAVKNAIRKIDLALPPCIIDYDCAWLPDKLFTAASHVDDMENLGVGLRPYAEQGDIQLLRPDSTHEMALGIGLAEFRERIIIQFLGRPFPEHFHQGVWCDVEQNPHFDPADAVTDDVTVYLWPDGDGNGIADGYTVTTGSITAGGAPPTVSPGTRRATICSDTGQETCQGPSNGDLCNLTGKVDVQFTWHALNQ